MELQKKNYIHILASGKFTMEREIEIKKLQNKINFRSSKLLENSANQLQSYREFNYTSPKEWHRDHSTKLFTQ